MPASSRTPITIQTLEDSKKPSATGTAASNRKLEIRIDEEEYGTITTAEDGTWNYVFPYKYSSLESGTHTFTIGYFQGTDTLVGSVSKQFEIPPEVQKTTKTVTFTVGEKTYIYDGKTGYMESAPFIDNNGRTLLPLRPVANTIGIHPQDIQWDNVNQMIRISVPKDKTSQYKDIIVYQIGSRTMSINGIESQIDTAPVIKDGVTFLPLRPLLNSLGITDNNITWNADTATVSYEV